MSHMSELSAERDQGLSSSDLESLHDIQREDRADRVRKDKAEEEVAPIIDAEGMNAVLLAHQSPHAALVQIRAVARDIRQMLRNGAEKEKISVAVNRIITLTGVLS